MSRRIVLCSTLLGRGGAETQLVRLALGLKARGWSPTIASMIDRNAFAEPLAEAEIPFVHFGMSRGRPDPRAAVKLFRLLRRERPHVVSSFLGAANALAAPTAQLARVPAVVTSVRTPVTNSTKRTRLYQAFAPFSDAIVFNSQGVMDEVRSAGLPGVHKARLVRNGLDTEMLGRAHTERVAVREELGLEADAFVWLVVANLRREKNYPTLVRAFRAVLEQYPHARMVSAGGLFEDHATLLKEAPDLLKSGALQLLGERHDIPRLLGAADAFVLASTYDASPNGLIEAVSARLPCIGTRVGGIPEILPNDRVGILAETPGYEDLRAAMMQMMAMTDDERAAMGAAAHAHAETTFGLATMVDAWESLYEDLLAKAGR